MIMTGKLFHYEKAAKLVDPKRQTLLPIEKVLSLLDLQEHDFVGDYGCGNGYFTIPIAKQVKTNVKAVDLQAEMLHLLKERAEKKQIFNIDYVEGALGQLSFQKHSFDKVLISFVLHEVKNLSSVFVEMTSHLKPGGKCVVLEWEAIVSETGPPVHHRISSNEMASKLKANGFEVEIGHMNKDIYYIVASIPNATC